MKEIKENLTQINEVSEMLDALSDNPLLTDKFVPSVIFQDFHSNLKMYLSKSE